MLRTKPRQRQWRNVARDNNQVNDIWKISDQAINQSMHRSLSAEVVIVVEHDDQLLLNVFQDFIQERINRAIRRARDSISGAGRGGNSFVRRKKDGTPMGPDAARAFSALSFLALSAIESFKLQAVRRFLVRLAQRNTPPPSSAGRGSVPREVISGS